MITALTTGGLGDIVYSIPILRILKVEKVYVKTAFYKPPYGNVYSAIKKLLESQGFEVGEYPPLPLYEYLPGIKIDFDIDTFRFQRNRGIHHIMISMRNQFKLSHADWKKPWLQIKGDRIIKEDYSLIHLTPRWRGGSKVNWKEILNRIKGKVYFIGFQEEYISFCMQYGNLEWHPAEDIFEMALLIRDCQALYCNQSVALTLAQGLGKDYFLERKPYKTNTLLFTANEHLL